MERSFSVHANTRVTHERVQILRGLLCATMEMMFCTRALPLVPSPICSQSPGGIQSPGQPHGHYLPSCHSLSSLNLLVRASSGMRTACLRLWSSSGGKVFIHWLSSRTLAVRPSHLPCQTPLSRSHCRSAHEIPATSQRLSR